MPVVGHQSFWRWEVSTATDILRRYPFVINRRQIVRLTEIVAIDTLFSIMLNGIFSETTLLYQVAAALRSRLPADWSLELSGDQLRRPAGRSQIDAVLILADPRGEAATITVEAKGRPFEARMVSSLLDRWQRALLPESREGPDAERSPSLMVISPFSGSLSQGEVDRCRRQLRGCHWKYAVRHEPAGGVH